MNNLDFLNKIMKYFEGRSEVSAVYLFGSYAKARERADSDIDIGILLKYEFISRQDDFYREYHIGLTNLTRMDVHIVIMNNAGEGILSQIFKYGKCVVNNSASELNKFKMRSYSMIADFFYQKNVMEKRFLEKYSEESR